MTSTTLIDSPPPRSRWHALDPLTRLVAAVATMAAALILGGVICPLVLLAITVIAPAVVAHELPRVLRLGLVLSLPLAVSAIVVNVLFTTGTTAEGIALAAEVVVRVLTMAGATVLFYATTRPAELVGSLRYHGSPARLTFVVHNAVAMIPRLADRAREVTDAQRARGLDTEGNWLRRGRGVVAIASPTVLGAVSEVETRTLALETRGFTRPGRATVLRVPTDSAMQRVGRWGALAGLVVLTVARVAGVLPC